MNCLPESRRTTSAGESSPSPCPTQGAEAWASPLSGSLSKSHWKNMWDGRSCYRHLETPLLQDLQQHSITGLGWSPHSKSLGRGPTPLFRSSPRGPPPGSLTHLGPGPLRASHRLCSCLVASSFHLCKAGCPLQVSGSRLPFNEVLPGHPKLSHLYHLTLFLSFTGPFHYEFAY